MVSDRLQTAESPLEETVRQRRPLPYSHLFRLLHWLLPATIIVGAVTGVSLHAAARPEWSLTAGVLPNWLLGGQIQVVHLLAAVLTTASLPAVLVLYWRRKTRRRAIHILLLLSGAVMIATGLLMLHPLHTAWVYPLARAMRPPTSMRDPPNETRAAGFGPCRTVSWGWC